MALTKPLSAVPQMEKTDNKLSMSQTTHVVQSMCTKYMLCCPINVYQIRVALSNHCVPNTSILITPSLLHPLPLPPSLFTLPPSITPHILHPSLNIQPSLPNITLHNPSSLYPHTPFFLHSSGSDTAISCEGVDMEDGEERSSLTPDSDLTMAGMTLHQLIQEHFTDLLRCLPRMWKMKILF